MNLSNKLDKETDLYRSAAKKKIEYSFWAPSRSRHLVWSPWISILHGDEFNLNVILDLDL